MKVKRKKYSNDEELFRIIVINLLIVFSIMFLSLLYNKKAEDDVILTPSSVTYETNTYVQYIERSENNAKQNLPIAGITEIMYGYMSDQSLSEDTSLTDVTVTDSCQKVLELTENEIYLLAKINECEAGNQNIETRMLVVLTVLNRVKSDKFPGTIEEVIKENHNGVYQFSPLVQGGSWYYTEPSDDAYKAVDLVTEELFNGVDASDGSLYFESCSDEDNWHSRNLEYLYQSGDIRFYK